MLDWSSRIDDLAYKLGREYGIQDRMAVEILLSALIDCPRTPLLWLCLETNWFQRDCLGAWFSFGALWTPCSLPRLRAKRPWRGVDAEIYSWFEGQDETRLFIEPDYERYPRFEMLAYSPLILQRTLRLRSCAPRGADPLQSLDMRNQERRADELAAATRYVLEDRVQSRPVDPPAFIEPKNFLYHCELTQKLAPWYQDWDTLVRAFALIAVRHAFLYGRTETEEEDHAAMSRVARDSIPVWIGKALAMLMEGPKETKVLRDHMALFEQRRRSGHGAQRELWRLHRKEIIRWNKVSQRWQIVENHREAVRAALAGRLFER